MKNYMIEYRKPVVLALARFADTIFKVFTQNPLKCMLSTPTTTLYREHAGLEYAYKLVTDDYTFTWETHTEHTRWFIEGSWEEPRTPAAKEVGKVVVALEQMVEWLGYDDWGRDMPPLLSKIERLEGETKNG